MIRWTIARHPDGATIEPVPGMRVHLTTLARRGSVTHEGTVQRADDDGLEVAVAADALADFWRVPGQAVSAALSHGGRRYLFDATLTGTTASPVPKLRLVLPEPAYAFRADERTVFRLPLGTELLPATVTTAGGTASTVSGVLVDLSAGGLQLKVRTPVPPGSRLALAVPTPPHGTVPVQAEVVAVSADGPEGPWRLHARFVALPPAAEQRIVRYLYEEQLRRRRTGTA